MSLSTETFVPGSISRKAIFEFSNAKPYIVVTDIANYYDYIQHAHLRNVMASQAEVRECILDLLIFILSTMTWSPDYMPRSHIGLPQIDLDAPRAFAHCFLFELDRFLRKQKDIEWTRYMDDIDIGVDDLPTAKRLLRDIDLVLQTRHVRLNTKKTKIMTAAEARTHFRIFENNLLNRIEDIVDGAPTRSILRKANRYITRGIEAGVRRSFFDSGNGQKVLKRALKIAASTGPRISNDVLVDVLNKYPALRQAIFLYLMKTGFTPSRFELIRNFLSSGHIVDQATYLHLTNALLGTSLKASKSNRERIRQLLLEYREDDAIIVSAKLSLLSKYGTMEELRAAIERTRSIWKHDTRLGRLVGVMIARFWSTFPSGVELLERFLTSVYSSGNRAAIDTLEFHKALKADKNSYRKIRKFLEKPNTSLPARISQPKFLMLLTVLNADYCDMDLFERLRSIYLTFGGDGFYYLQCEYAEMRFVTGPPYEVSNVSPSPESAAQ